jgi:hypothetical protein
MPAVRAHALSYGRRSTSDASSRTSSTSVRGRPTASGANSGMTSAAVSALPAGLEPTAGLLVQGKNMFNVGREPPGYGGVYPGPRCRPPG